MANVAKPASGLDNKKQKKSTKTIATRKKVEAKLATNSRKLICPDGLTDIAKQEWARIVAVDNAREEHIIYDSDMALLQVLCEMWAIWVTVQREWANSPIFLGVDKVTGEVVQNPYVAEMRRLSKEMKPLYAAFALTPQGRAQFGVEIAKNETKKKDYIRSYLFHK